MAEPAAQCLFVALRDAAVANIGRIDPVSLRQSLEESLNLARVTAAE